MYKPVSNTEQTEQLKIISKKVWQMSLGLTLQILSALITLGDAPFIRYFDPTQNGEGISAKLAHILKKDIEELQSIDDSFPPATDFRKTILIIVDRSFDMMAPFVHEFTYQAMAQDLFSALGGAAGTPVGDSQTTSLSLANLDENDPIWVFFESELTCRYRT